MGIELSFGSGRTAATLPPVVTSDQWLPARASPLALATPPPRSNGHCRHPPNGSASSTYSGLMPANLTTFAHFSISSAMSLPKSAGEPASAVAPRSASRAFTLGSARPAFISLLSLSMISGGVLLGRADAVPIARLVARHEIAHSRHVRQRLRARRRGHRQRAQLAGLDVLDRRTAWCEHRPALDRRSDRSAQAPCRDRARAPCRRRSSS